jgi:hypothetical protein
MSAATPLPQATELTAIADVAQILLRWIERSLDLSSAKQRAVATALWKDERMGSVWGQVFRRHTNGEFFYPVNPSALNQAARVQTKLVERYESTIRLDEVGSHNEARRLELQIEEYEADRIVEQQAIDRKSPTERQEMACIEVYRAAFFAAESDVTTESDAIAEKRSLEFIATQLEAHAGLASRLLNRPVEVIEVATHLRREAKKQFISRDDRLLVKRHRGDGRLRAFVKLLDCEMIDLFGTSMYGQIALMGNVVFGRSDITQPMVREMTRN